ncbi:MAG: hypothetical protein M3439_01755, partial [Chloroflexota bacterium]|nr:hypothetical protein [Chloroflexota bacterium]
MAEMAAEENAIRISPDSELGIALRRASVEHEPIIIRIGSESYAVDVFETRSGAESMVSTEPDAILGIIG